jgi:predicted DNA-binding transcriptional regulator AlpA
VDIFPTPSGGRADAARAAVAFEQRSWIPATELADELGISRRTLARWLRDVALGFPRPKIVNHRLYFERSAIDQWKTATALKWRRRANKDA